MVRITKEIGIDMGHRVPNHASKCANLHGHRYRIIAEVEAPDVVPDTSGRTDAGMVMDFGVLKEILMEKIHDVYDHKTALWKNDPYAYSHHAQETPGILTVPVVPTAENLARFWFDLIELEVRRRSLHALRLTALIVWETPTSMAEYRGSYA